MKTQTPLLWFPLITAPLLAMTISLSAATGQQPRSQPTSLLSRDCNYDSFYPLNEQPPVSSGRELFNAIFRLYSHPNYNAFLTCNILSDPTDPNRRFVGTLRLKFGLPDSSDPETRVTVSAYVDGEQWGTTTIAPRSQATEWLIDVSEARSVSLEAVCIADCWSSRNNDVYFFRADLEPATADFLESTGAQETVDPERVNAIPYEDQPYVTEEPTQQETNPQHEEPSRSRFPNINLPEAIPTIERIIRIFQ